MKLKTFDLQLFGGGSSSTTSRTIPNQTAEEANLQTGLYNYGTTGLNSASGLLSSANNAIGSTYNPNYSTLANNYNTTMNNVSSGYSDLANGVLPSSYATARQTALNNDLTSTVGSAINSLANRGIVNSSVTNAALNNISQNAANTLADKYSSDLTTQSNLLSNQATQAQNTLSGNATAQAASYTEPTQLFNYASNDANSGTNLFNTLYGGRMGTGSTTTSSNNNSGMYSAIGTLGAAAITCFVGGTMIATPDGDKPIEEIKVGDKVYSMDGLQTVVFVQEPIYSLDEYLTITDGEKTATTTSTQVFVTPQGDKFAAEFDHVPAEKEPVYDLSTTGSNTYFANGFVARGREI